MNDNEYLGISAFSSAVGVKPQGIYERINKKNNAIHKYIKPNSKPTKIHISAIKELYGITLTSALSSTLTSTLQSQEKRIESVKVPLQKTSKKNVHKKIIYKDKMIASLERQIEEQKQELKKKDEFIENVMARLQESQKLLDQQQQLALADKKLLIAGNKPKEKSKWYHFWKRGGEENSNVKV